MIKCLKHRGKMFLKTIEALTHRHRNKQLTCFSAYKTDKTRKVDCYIHGIKRKYKVDSGANLNNELT